MRNMLTNKYVFSLIGLISIALFVNVGAYFLYYLLSMAIPELASPGIEMGGLIFYLPLAITLLIIAIVIFSKISKKILGREKSKELGSPMVFWFIVIFIFNIILLPLITSFVG